MEYILYHHLLFLMLKLYVLHYLWYIYLFFNIFKNLDLKKSWERYSKFHLHTSLIRILLTIILVNPMNVQQVDYTDKYYMATI